MCKWIVEDIKKHDGHLTCGHIGMRYIFNVLTKYGYNDVIKEFLDKEDYPSYGEQIKHGATTLYESWSISNDQSYNHFFKGGYAVWLYNDVLGIKNTSVAYKTFDIKPTTIDIIKKAKGSVDTVYGKIEVDYSVGEYFNVNIPANTTATVYVPNEDLTYTKHILSSGSYSL
jgi:alpha-L-rhamnosidase